MNQHMADAHGVTVVSGRRRNAAAAVAGQVLSVATRNNTPSVNAVTTASGLRVPMSVPGNIRGYVRGVGAHSLSANELGGLEEQAGYHNSLKEVIVSRLGFRPDSSEYFMKALHPMDEEVFGGTRIPDSTTDATVALELRVTGNLSTPLTDDSSWDMDVYFPPFPDVAYAYNSRKAGTASSGILTYVFYPATTSGKLGPNGNQPILQANADAWRGVYRGATFQMTASSLNNDGEIYAGQYGMKFRGITLPELKDDAGAVTRYYANTFTCDQVPLTTDELVQKVSGYVQLPAKCGLYLPVRYTDPVHLFQEGNGIPFITGSNADGHDQENVVAGDTLVSAPVNFMMGVVMFRGLNSKATIALKCRTGVEAIPDSRGTWGAFSESSPMMDRDAMDTVIKIRHTLALAYPASYNDLSAIWNAIRSGFEALAKPTWGATRQIGRFLGKIEGIPYVGRFGRGLETASDQLLAGIDAMNR